MRSTCVAILCVHDEEAHLERAIGDFIAQGIDVAVIDHGSSDRTPEILARFIGHGLVHVENMPWTGEYDQTAQLQAKQALLARLDHDWVIHADADEWMHTRVAGESLLEGIARLEGQGYNAINFEEFVFLPRPDAVREPDDCKRQLLDYYFFEPGPRRLMRAWRRDQGLSNVDSGGHVLSGPDLRLAPEPFVLRHYIVLSQAQAYQKYGKRVFSDRDLARGWHGNRVNLDSEKLRLPWPSELQHLDRWDDVDLDRSAPKRLHYWQWPLEERGVRDANAAKRLGSGRLLVCIYTCEQHRPLLQRFRDSEVGRLLRETPGVQTVEVVADPGPASPRMQGDEMVLDANELYEELSIKTHRMIEFSVRNLHFDNLLKIDVTTAMTEMDSPEYAERKPIDMAALATFLRQADYSLDYTGFVRLEGAGQAGAENWARKKGGRIDYLRVFGDGPMPPFFSGKCYLLSRRFAEFIARSGAAVAAEQAEHFLGSEDVMVGRLYQKFLGSVAA